MPVCIIESLSQPPIIFTTAPEFIGKPFTVTYIYGFYHGNMTFVEPMITKAFLETHPDFTLPIKQPQAYGLTYQ